MRLVEYSSSNDSDISEMPSLTADCHLVIRESQAGVRVLDNIVLSHTSNIVVRIHLFLL